MLAAKPNPSNNLVASRVPLRLQRVGLRSGDFDGRRIDHEHRPPGQPDFALVSVFVKLHIKAAAWLLGGSSKETISPKSWTLSASPTTVHINAT
eukprot:6435547-Pyramimonas_sp.AAC.1